jgi:hypothetical protein
MTTIGMIGAGSGWVLVLLLLFLVIVVLKFLLASLMVAGLWYFAGRKKAAMKLGIPSMIVVFAMIIWLIIHWND